MSDLSRISLLAIVTVLCITVADAQDKIRLLPSNINRPSINLYAPFISGDGSTIVYLSDYTDDGMQGMRWSTSKTVTTWNDELEVTKLINRPSLNFRGGYSLSFDGTMLLFTSRKSGLGGFDLWYSNRKGNDWQAPGNFGSPVNSSENEGAPMLSADGEYLYFMRCDKMTEYQGASGCTILVSKKTYNGWSDAKELPANINTGNSQTPRILADGQTLIFASDQMGGKGGLDLFMSTKSGDSWSDPVAMDFINTDKNDQFISVPARGRYLYADRAGEMSNELVQVLMPDEFQPKRLMLVQGTVTDANTGKPLNANLTVFDIGERNRLWNEKVGPKGEFSISLKEGAAYDLAIDIDPTYMYFAKIYDLEDGVGSRDKENLRIQLTPIQSGASYPSDIVFNDYSSELSDLSTFELRRMAELLRKNESMKIEISVHQENYLEDSLQSHPDLTEVILDSIILEIKRPLTIDSSVLENDTIHNWENDSLAVSEYEINEADSTYYEEEEVVEYEIVEQLEIKRTYHNDRTVDQAAAIKEYLVGRGVEVDRIQLKTSRSKSIREESEDDLSKVKVEIKVLDI